jgi:hypothetical protein
LHRQDAAQISVQLRLQQGISIPNLNLGCDVVIRKTIEGLATKDPKQCWLQQGKRVYNNNYAHLVEFAEQNKKYHRTSVATGTKK